MVSINTDNNHNFLKTTDFIDPPPISFLPPSSKVEEVFRTEYKGFRKNNKRWKGHYEVYLIFTQSHLYVIGANENEGDYLSIPYSAAHSVNWSSRTFRDFKSIKFSDENNNEYVAHIDTIYENRKLESLSERMSLENGGGNITEGKVSELYRQQFSYDVEENMKFDIYDYNDELPENLPRRRKSHTVGLSENNISIIEQNEEGINERDLFEWQKIADVSEREFWYSLIDTRFGGAIGAINEKAKKDLSKDIIHLRGVEVVTVDDVHIYFYHSDHHSDEEGYPEFPADFSTYIRDQIENFSNNKLPFRYMLVNPFDKRTGTLKIEGWTEGDSTVNASITADSESKGKSRGVELGMFSRSKTSSKSSIEGDVSGKISDNKYAADVTAFKIYDDKLVIDSEIKLSLHYPDIDNVYEHSEGVVIDTNTTTFRVEGLSEGAELSAAIDFIETQLTGSRDKDETEEDTSSSENKGTTDKIRELNALYEEGILSETEFESKKNELLDDF